MPIDRFKESKLKALMERRQREFEENEAEGIPVRCFWVKYGLTCSVCAQMISRGQRAAMYAGPDGAKLYRHAFEHDCNPVRFSPRARTHQEVDG